MHRTNLTNIFRRKDLVGQSNMKTSRRIDEAGQRVVVYKRQITRWGIAHEGPKPLNATPHPLN